MRLNHFPGCTFALLALPFLAGCGSAAYYAQAVGGQMELLSRAQPVSEVVADPGSPAPLKQKLDNVRRIREFASRELNLPQNGSYLKYADLGRPFAVWNVFAAPEFSVRPKEWCHLVAGCVNYRGYFSRDEAERFAEEAHRSGHDVYVAGVPAYSTLGWFDDPLLNTFIHFPETQIAALIFHELAHQLVYTTDDSTFNESFATAVEQEGMRRWLEHEGTAEQRAAHEAARSRKHEFTALVLKYRDKLAELYAGPADDRLKREEKARLLRGMREEYGLLKAAWGGYAGYDRWFAQPLSNAQLASVAVYTRLVPAFQNLLAANQGDLPRFYTAVKALSRLPKDARAAQLQAHAPVL